MTCTTAHQLIQEALDLPGAPQPALEAHLATCGACRSYEEGMRRVARDLNSLSQEAAPSVLMERLGLATPRARQAGRRWLPMGVVAAALLIVTGLGPRLQQMVPGPAATVAAVDPATAVVAEAPEEDLLEYFDPGETTLDPLASL